MPEAPARTGNHLFISIKRFAERVESTAAANVTS
jgi:hypothetical protein